MSYEAKLLSEGSSLMNKLCYCLPRGSSFLVVRKLFNSVLLHGPALTAFAMSLWHVCSLGDFYLTSTALTPPNSWPQITKSLCLYDSEFGGFFVLFSFVFFILLELLRLQHHSGYFKPAFPNLTSVWCQLPYLFSAQKSSPDSHIKRLTRYITVRKTPQNSGQQPGFKRPWTNFCVVSHDNS